MSRERERTILHLEDATAELLYAVARLNDKDLSHSDRRQRRRELLESARRYARAVDALARRER